MDPVITIASKLGSIVVGKGLTILLNDLFPDETLNNIKDGVNVLREKEFHAATNWLKQASFRADRDYCMLMAEENAQKATYTLQDIKLKVQAYSMCMLAGYYNASSNGKDLLSGKRTVLTYLYDLQSAILTHFKGLSPNETRQKVFKDAFYDVIEVYDMLPIVVPLLGIGLSIYIRETVLNKELPEIFSNVDALKDEEIIDLTSNVAVKAYSFYPNVSKVNMQRKIESKIISSTTLIDSRYCEKMLVYLKDAATNLPEAGLGAS